VTTSLGLGLQGAGNFLLLVGETRDELTGSAYAREVLGEPDGAPPSLDLAREARLQELVVLAAEGRWARAAHDVSDGGLAVALAEMVMASPPERGLGLEVDLAVLEASAPAALFSERPAILLEVAPERAARVFQAARDRSLLAWPIGTVAAAPLLRARLPGGDTVQWTADELRAAAEAPLARLWNEREEEA
jgi:phosphoribosylformylglycinamidine synthase